MFSMDDDIEFYRLPQRGREASLKRRGKCVILIWIGYYTDPDEYHPGGDHRIVGHDYSEHIWATKFWRAHIFIPHLSSLRIFSQVHQSENEVVYRDQRRENRHRWVNSVKSGRVHQ
jgi:hypothetical protein